MSIAGRRRVGYGGGAGDEASFGARREALLKGSKKIEIRLAKKGILRYDLDNREKLNFLEMHGKLQCLPPRKTMEKGGAGMPKKLFRVVYALNYIFQAAFSMLTPTGLMVLLGWWLTERRGWGRWAMAVCVILGVGLGVYSMFYFIIKTAKHVDPTQPEKEDDRERKNK